MRAEVGNSAVVRAAAAIEHSGIEESLDSESAPELTQRAAGKNQLTVEAEQVKRARTFARIEAAQRMVILARHQLGLGLLHRFRIGAPLPDHVEHGVDKPLGMRAPNHGLGNWREAATNRRVGVAEQPVLGFHDVAVGVVIDSSLRVRHLRTRSIVSSTNQYRS